MKLNKEGSRASIKASSGVSASGSLQPTAQRPVAAIGAGSAGRAVIAIVAKHGAVRPIIGTIVAQGVSQRRVSNKFKKKKTLRTTAIIIPPTIPIDGVVVLVALHLKPVRAHNQQHHQ